MTALTARADVPTETPQRYAKQLLSHLGRRTAWTTDGDTSTAEIAGGTGRVVLGDGVLTLIAEAPDTATLERVQHVLGSHLERFGQRNELAVSWVGDAAPGGAPTPPASADHHRPGGPFLPLSRYPQLTAHVRQVASLARDAQLFREGRGWTRKKLAEVAGLNEQTYGDFEAGRTWPVPSTLYRVAEALNADLRLVGRGTQPSPERRRC